MNRILRLLATATFASAIFAYALLAPTPPPRPTAPICQREEGGEIIAYPPPMTPRRGFDRIPCP